MKMVQIYETQKLTEMGQQMWLVNSEHYKMVWKANMLNSTLLLVLFNNKPDTKI